MTWFAPGKLNLFLHITGQRADGYHLLQTVFQFIELSDLVRIERTDDGEIKSLHQIPGVPAETDLTVRAAKRLRQITGCRFGAAIHLTKNLPVGGGVGGGSSDAATVLLVLNRLWDTGLSHRELAEIGLELGADVPVFIHGHACWAEGVGEEIMDIDLPEPVYLLIDTKIHVSTAGVFGDSELTRNTQPIRIADFLAGNTRNDCESVVRRRYPAINQAMNWLSQFSQPQLTGTGACVFAVFDSEKKAQEARVKCPAQWQAYVVKGSNRSPLHRQMEMN
jgi:4-diphosphocytidyl-2-C-methyl-D-erythritol kinase